MASQSWNVPQLPFSFSKALVPENLWHTEKTALHVKSWDWKYLCKEQQGEHYAHYAIWKRHNDLALASDSSKDPV